MRANMLHILVPILVGISLAGCNGHVLLRPPKPIPQSDNAIVINAQDAANFTYSKGTGGFLDPKGQTLRSWLSNQNLTKSDRILVEASDIETLQSAKKTILQAPSLKNTKLPTFFDIADTINPLAMVKITISRSRWIYPNCHDISGRYRMGCAVEINRAQSISDPVFYVQGRPLSQPQGAVEIAPLRNLYLGKTAPLKSASEVGK